jgi:hypothetical protein
MFPSPKNEFYASSSQGILTVRRLLLAASYCYVCGFGRSRKAKGGCAGTIIVIAETTPRSSNVDHVQPW